MEIDSAGQEVQIIHISLGAYEFGQYFASEDDKVYFISDGKVFVVDMDNMMRRTEIANFRDSNRRDPCCNLL